MDYVVLARKLRPARFQDLIGQDTVARALRNAVAGGRTAHAYLFAGSRGVGKTSAARILTKALNCLDPREGEPCNACGNCEEITRGACPDVLEIDAASNRGIDNIRELRDNTKYAPAKCAYKTYIIDEVHMLTMESFNALLKTLEEPPPHVKFILATTAPHRVPETILSRCQRYDFPRIPLGPMVEYLSRVTADEGISLSARSLETIARNASGGMRDALTAVEQVVAFAGLSATDEQVLSVLEVMDTGQVLALLGALLDGSLEQALDAFNGIVAHGHDLATLLEAMLREVKDFALYKSIGSGSVYFQDHPPATLEFYSARNEGVSLDVLQQIFYLLLELESQLKLSEHRWACFEMALIKACRVEPLVGVPELLARLQENTARENTAQGHTGGPAASGPETPAAPVAQPERRPPAQSRPRGREGGTDARTGGAASTTARDREGEPEGPALSGAVPSGAAAAVDPAPPAADTQPETPADHPTPDGAADTPPQSPPQPPPQSPSQPPQSGAGMSAGGAAVDPEGAPAPAHADPSGATSPAADTPADEAVEEPSLEEALPCEDDRWLALVDAVRGSRRKLAADLRRAEVAAIAEAELELVLPGAAADFTEPDLAFLRESLRKAFGAPFALRLNRDSNRKARHGYTLVGREEQRERARLAALREAAASDEAIQRVLRAFPQGRIERIHPATAAQEE